MALIIQIIPILLAILGFVIIWLARDNKPVLWIETNHRNILPDFDAGINKGKRIIGL